MSCCGDGARREAVGDADRGDRGHGAAGGERGAAQRLRRAWWRVGASRSGARAGRSGQGNPLQWDGKPRSVRGPPAPQWRPPMVENLRSERARFCTAGSGGAEPRAREAAPMRPGVSFGIAVLAGAVLVGVVVQVAESRRRACRNWRRALGAPWLVAAFAAGGLLRRPVRPARGGGAVLLAGGTVVVLPGAGRPRPASCGMRRRGPRSPLALGRRRGARRRGDGRARRAAWRGAPAVGAAARRRARRGARRRGAAAAAEWRGRRAAAVAAPRSWSSPRCCSGLHVAARAAPGRRARRLRCSPPVRGRREAEVRGAMRAVGWPRRDA